MAYTVTRANYGELNNVPLSTPAWWIVNLEPECLSGPALKGADIDVPHAHGVLANPRRRAATVKQFEMKISSVFKWDGTTHPDPVTGIRLNVKELTANIGLASVSGDGTVPFEWHYGDGSSEGADVTVVRFEVSDLLKRHAQAVLEISVPTGTFAALP